MVVTFFSLTPFMLFFFLLWRLIIPYRHQARFVFYVNRSSIFIWSVLTGMRYTITGQENIDQNQNYVCVLNHTNSGDMMAGAYGIKVDAKPLVKKSLTRIPVLGQMFQVACIPVDRSSREARKKSKDTMLNDLKQHISVLLFAEGTRNRTGKPLKEFYDGAFDLAVSANVPIMPIVLTNMRKLNPKHDWVFQPGIIEVRHLPPIFPKENTPEEADRLKELTFNAMWNCMVEYDEAFKDFEKK
jgi:1-acyl-sn-glycerol-3-phosphate acyltransferase